MVVEIEEGYGEEVSKNFPNLTRLGNVIDILGNFWAFEVQSAQELGQLLIFLQDAGRGGIWCTESARPGGLRISVTTD